MDCEGNTLKILQTLRVEVGTVAGFSGCGFESEIEGAMLVTEGKVEISGCRVEGLKGRAFEVSGELNVHNSDFEGNQNSIYSFTKFGFSVSVTNSRFEGNVSPQGTVLFLQPSGTLTNSSTRISFDQCEFRDNAASIVGSFMYVAVPNAKYFTASQLYESKSLSITNSVFMNSPGYLWYLQLRHLNVSFHNNTIQHAENPIFLALFDNSFIMVNTNIGIPISADMLRIKWRSRFITSACLPSIMR